MAKDHLRWEETHCCQFMGYSYWLEQELAEWVHQAGLIKPHITSWVDTTTGLQHNSISVKAS